jgi:hypothetical protein
VACFTAAVGTPPIALPDLDGTGETLEVTPRAVKDVCEWFAKTAGLATEPKDVKHAIEAAAYMNGQTPYHFLSPALRTWEDEL